MSRTFYASAILVLAIGCSEVAPEPEKPVSTSAAAISPPLDPAMPFCPQRLGDAKAVTSRDGLRGFDTEIDFNQDGINDCIFEGYETLYLFLRDESQIKYLGSVHGEAMLGVRCTEVIDSNGFCRVRTGYFMIHGEVQRESFRFDGKRYVSTGERVLYPWPRKS